ncbi:MAG: hypothetical protein ING08_06465 [Roseomonas sp.]|nr:hypothetical protein [Roseomonas sp.]
MTLDLKQAKDLYAELAASSYVPSNPLAPCIPFMYPVTFCWARAHDMCRRIMAKGITPKKIWARAPNTPNNYDYALKIWTANNPNCEQKWSWHVAPLIEVSVGNVIEEYVIGPSIFDALATRSAWELVVTATHNVTGQTKPAIHTVSSWTQYQFDDPNFPNNPKLISPYAFNTCTPTIFP